MVDLLPFAPWKTGHIWIISRDETQRVKLDSKQRQLEVAYGIGEHHVTKKSLFSVGYYILTG